MILLRNIYLVYACEIPVYNHNAISEMELATTLKE
jgi:hypothetical protein